MLEDFVGSGGSCGNVYFDNFVISDPNAPEEKLDSDTNAGKAPAGYTCTKDMTLCFKKMTAAASAHNAIGACKTDEARVCEYLDHMQLCAQGLNAKDHGNQGWFGDHGKASRGNSDDEYGTWNRNSCNSNTDGPAKHAGEKKVYSCCRGSVDSTAECPAATSKM
jgi:hypothetical protein